MYSRHYEQERRERERLIQTIGVGTIVYETVVDTGDIRGPVLYQITDNAIIIMSNSYTHKIITKIIARPGQIRRYYPNAPKELIVIAEMHKTMGYHF